MEWRCKAPRSKRAQMLLCVCTHLDSLSLFLFLFFVSFRGIEQQAHEMAMESLKEQARANAFATQDEEVQLLKSQL